MAHSLTITLTDAPPIKIDRDLWPVLTQHTVPVKTFEDPGRFWMIVLQHADGRTIVFGCAALHSVPERRWGRYHATPLSMQDLVQAIKEVGAQIHPDLAQGCISKLPAVEV